MCQPILMRRKRYQGRNTCSQVLRWTWGPSTPDWTAESTLVPRWLWTRVSCTCKNITTSQRQEAERASITNIRVKRTSSRRLSRRERPCHSRRASYPRTIRITIAKVIKIIIVQVGALLIPLEMRKRQSKIKERGTPTTKWTKIDIKTIRQSTKERAHQEEATCWRPWSQLWTPP